MKIQNLGQGKQYLPIHSRKIKITVQFTGCHDRSCPYLDFLRFAWVGLAPVSVKKHEKSISNATCKAQV